MVGVEAAYGFGDGLFLAPLLKRIAERTGGPVEVAVQAQCADAFANLPWVGKITHIANLHDGAHMFRMQGRQNYQITPNVYFPEFANQDPSHSLIDCALWTGRTLGFGDIDQRPIFVPTAQEEGTNFGFARPVIAVESHYKSGQSWATEQAFAPIIKKYKGTHDIAWLSSGQNPPGTHNMSRYSRRQLIPLLGRCERFFSVGSGFFCASLALPKPPPTVCLWLDHYYRYEGRLAQLGWNPAITWVHNMNELGGAL